MASKRQLFNIIESLLPFAEAEVRFLCDDFESDPEDLLRGRVGADAVETAKLALNSPRESTNWSLEKRAAAAERMRQRWTDGKMGRQSCTPSN